MQDVPGRLGKWNEFSDTDIQVIESFVCDMYGKKSFSAVNDARLEMLLSKYKPKGRNDSLLANLKKTDASSLPPFSKVLLQKIKRSSYITSIWQNSVESIPPVNDPLYLL